MRYNASSLFHPTLDTAPLLDAARHRGFRFKCWTRRALKPRSFSIAAWSYPDLTIMWLGKAKEAGALIDRIRGAV